MLALPAAPPDFGVLPHQAVYEAAVHQVEDPVAKRAAPDAHRADDSSPDVLVIPTHDTPLLDVLEFFPAADLTDWEKQPLRKDICYWKLLSAQLEGVLGTRLEKKL